MFGPQSLFCIFSVFPLFCLVLRLRILSLQPKFSVFPLFSLFHPRSCIGEYLSINPYSVYSYYSHYSAWSFDSEFWVFNQNSRYSRYSHYSHYSIHALVLENMSASILILYILTIPIILPGPLTQNFEASAQILFIPNILTIPSTLFYRRRCWPQSLFCIFLLFPLFCLVLRLRIGGFNQNSLYSQYSHYSINTLV